MASISAGTFEVIRSNHKWLPDVERKRGQARYFEVRGKRRRSLEKDYIVVVRDDGSYEVLRRSDAIPPMGERWPDACRKIGFAIILAITNEIGDPWAP